jgi:hypothetical protein
MKTASHFTYFGPGRVVISLGNPRGVVGGYKMFKALAPKREWMKAPKDVYRELFKTEVLGELDPQETWDKLHRLHGDGSEPVLQCFERPPFSDLNWCHRRMVAKWFEETLGHPVPEIGYTGPDFI